MKLQVSEEPILAPATVGEPPEFTSFEDEVMYMVSTIGNLNYEQPDIVMTTCMAFMARCTEMWLQLLHVEKLNRKAKTFRTMEVQKVMELIEFEFKGASRLIEVRRQEVELSK